MLASLFWMLFDARLLPSRRFGIYAYVYSLVACRGLVTLLNTIISTLLLSCYLNVIRSEEPIRLLVGDYDPLSLHLYISCSKFKRAWSHFPFRNIRLFDEINGNSCSSHFDISEIASHQGSWSFFASPRLYSLHEQDGQFLSFYRPYLSRWHAYCLSSINTIL